MLIFVIILVQVYNKLFLRRQTNSYSTSKFEPMICWWQHDERKKKRTKEFSDTKPHYFLSQKIDCNHRLSSLLSRQQPPKFFRLNWIFAGVFMSNLLLSIIWLLGEDTLRTTIRLKKTQETRQNIRLLFSSM